MNKNNFTAEFQNNQHKDSNTTKSKQKVNPEELNRTNDNILFGLLGGIQIVILLLIAQSFSVNFVALKFLKYIALFFVLGYGLGTQKAYMENNYSSMNGIQLGLIVTATISIILTLANAIAFLVSPDLAFTTFWTQAGSVENLAELSGNLFIEILVFGIIMTCIITYMSNQNDVN